MIRYCANRVCVRLVGAHEAACPRCAAQLDKQLREALVAAWRDRVRLPRPYFHNLRAARVIWAHAAFARGTSPPRGGAATQGAPGPSHLASSPGAPPSYTQA